MCRLLSFVAETPSTCAAMLGDDQATAFQELARVHADGWGVMWIRPRPGPFGPSLARMRAQHDGRDDASLRVGLRQTPATAGVAHLRMATEGLGVEVANNHPFIRAGIGLAHNGSITPTPVLAALLSDASLDELIGTTDSEMYHALVVERIADGLSPADATMATVRQLREHFPTASLNAMLLTRSELLVVHSSSEAVVPHDDLALRSGQLLPPGHDEDYYRMSMRRVVARHPAHPGQPEQVSTGVVFASSGLDDHGWHALPQDSLTVVDLVDLSVRIRPLGTDPVPRLTDPDAQPADVGEHLNPDGARTHPRSTGAPVVSSGCAM